MATGITGRLIRRTTKEPLQGITIEAVDASTGAPASTTTTTDTKGFFELSGLASAVYFPKALVSGDDWDLLTNIAEIYTDEIHVASDGSLTIDGSVSAAKNIVLINLTDTATTGAVRGVMSNITSSGADNVTGVASYITKSAGGNATGLLSSVQSTLSSGTLSEVKAVEALAFTTGSSGGTITSQFGGYFVSQATGGSASVTSNYGILVGPDSGGTNNYGINITGPSSGANNYAIKSDATAKSYFAGAVDVVGALTHNGTAVSDSGHGASDHANRTRYLHLVPIGWDVTIAASPRYMTFADGATTSVVFGAVLPEDYVGSSCTLKFLYGSSVTSNNLRIATNVYQDRDGQAEGNIDTNTRTVAVSGSANVMTLFSEAIGSNPTAGSYIKVLIQRIGADAADTNTGTARITTPWIEYTADM